MEGLHFVLFPFMAKGHLIPLVDIGRLLAQREGVIVTIITTPLNASRVHKTVSRAMESGHRIRLIQIQFPFEEVGLPEGHESQEMMSSPADFLKLYKAGKLMQEEVLKLFENEKITPPPNCIISDFLLPYTTKISSEFKVPRISFHTFGCFCLLCMNNVQSSNILESITSDSEYFTVPGLPDSTVKFTKLQLPVQLTNMHGIWKAVFETIREADVASYGVVINSFEELESSFVKEYKKVRKEKAWCIGPVSLSHKDEVDMAQRGNDNASDSIMNKDHEHQCLKWLDSQEPNSVIYASIGTCNSLSLSQWKEYGLGLEASNKPFIWVIGGDDDTLKQLENWMKEDGFEERIKGKGLLILGWAPQVLILLHPAIGGFLTHCGWNSTIEGISAGLPLITWPLAADQFCNAKLVVQVLKIGVSLGVEKPNWAADQEKDGVTLKKEDIKIGIQKLMDEGNEGMERRKRAKEFGEKAKKAVEVGGSSHVNITLFIQDIMQQSLNKCCDLGPSSQGEEI